MALYRNLFLLRSVSVHFVLHIFQFVWPHFMKTQVITAFDIGIVLDHTQSSTVFTPMADGQKAAPSWTRPSDAEIHS